MVAEEHTVSGAQFRVRVQTPTGASSDALLATGDVSLNVRGPTQLGRNGEPRVFDTLLCKLREEGHQPIFKEGRDQFGEDGILQFQGQDLTLQVVSVPSCPKLWRDANRDSAKTVISVEDGAKWIRDAVRAKFTKTSPRERPKTILVLDVGLVGILSAQEVTNVYLACYGEPHLEFEFASIWLVGPTPSTTTRLGTIGCL